jgi:hypothetical protein
MLAVDLSSATGAPAPTRRRPRALAGLALAGLATAMAATACTAGPDRATPAGPYQLVFFDSCDNALSDLKAAAKAVVGPYGLPGQGYGWGSDGALPPTMAEDRATSGGAPGAAPGPAVAPDANKGAPDYSGTNTHESGVDEPDLVKTDGRRIVTVTDGRLSVVDAQAHRLVGAVDLGTDLVGYDADLLIAGDHALVLANQPLYYYDHPVLDLPVVPEGQTAGRAGPAPSDPQVEHPVVGSTLVLVDLTGPRILSRATLDGSLVDARQVGDIG